MKSIIAKISALTGRATMILGFVTVILQTLEFFSKQIKTVIPETDAPVKTEI